MKVPIIIHESRFELTEYWRAKIKQAIKESGAPIRAEIQTITPESRQQRKYLHGGLMPLLVFLDNNDYKDSEVLEHYFEHYKREFTPEVLKIGGKIQTFGKSSKGSKALNKFITSLQDHLHDQYGIAYDNPAINPDKYVEWRDTLSMSTDEDFIEYCVRMKWISNVTI